ncbi:MAG: type II toxin-antitoxin system PrlF family antitoxin [Oxalobacteraceae bacterium]
MSPNPIRLQSTLTDRYQTTVPETVRRALNVSKRDRIEYTIKPDGEVVIARAEPVGEDPALDNFLAFLAADIAANPQHLVALDSSLAKQLQALTESVVIDLNQPLDADDE